MMDLGITRDPHPDADAAQENPTATLNTAIINHVVMAR
jgi:hypothetical protein